MKFKPLAVTKDLPIRVANRRGKKVVNAARENERGKESEREKKEKERER